MIENNMITAPTDGTRILALCEERGYTGHRYEVIGHSIKEIWWTTAFLAEAPKWHLWCGREETHSTEHIIPVRWMPIPEDMTIDAN